MKVFFQFHRKFHLQWIEHEIQEMGEYSVIMTIKEFIQMMIN